MPGWLAGYLGTIADLTGWSKEYILWELPLSEGFQLQHVALVKAGLRTVATEESILSDWDAITEDLTNVGGSQSQIVA